MHFALLILALQVRATAFGDVSQRMGNVAAADSARDLKRAYAAQASFERSRRALLPISYGSYGRGDGRLGRFCWWYDPSRPTFPPEAQTIGHRLGDLLAELDTRRARYPSDDWLAGMPV